MTAAPSQYADVYPSTLTVVHVEECIDMRQVHEFRECERASKLKPGECILGFNFNAKIVRIIDYELGIHTYYADEGEKFDLELVKARVRSGMATIMVMPKTPKEQKQRRHLKVA